jgi:hypothetical protein
MLLITAGIICYIVIGCKNHKEVIMSVKNCDEMNRRNQSVAVVVICLMTKAAFRLKLVSFPRGVLAFRMCGREDLFCLL